MSADEKTPKRRKKGDEIPEPEPQQTEEDAGKKKSNRTCIVIVALVVFFLLAYCSISVYNGRKHEVRGRQHEAFLILSSIRQAEREYYELNNKFSDDPEEIGLDLAFSPKVYKYKITLTDDNGYEVEVWGNIDGDDTIDRWRMYSYDDLIPINECDDVNE